MEYIIDLLPDPSLWWVNYIKMPLQIWVWDNIHYDSILVGLASALILLFLATLHQLLKHLNKCSSALYSISKEI
ncbi:MAG: hypothetical protein R3Y31_06360 [Rikenellaceae bacterium]